jgi:(p)ppGpp synthase/HD superfamily hydrolase
MNSDNQDQVKIADLQRAIEIAVEAHKNQLQKNGLPYVLHPFQLMLSVQSNTAKIVAVLHDVVEDSDWTLENLKQEGFSQEVLAAIECLTHRQDESYTDYIDRIAANKLATVVKLADLKDNMNITRIADELLEKDFQRLKQYHQAWQKLSNF